jgi:predicted amidohydrolase YtcJ
MTVRPQDALAATLILRNGRIWTGNPVRPEASAIAIKDHRILAVGADEEAMAWAGTKTRIIDLGGRRVVPGFIDNHNHFLAPRGEQLTAPDFASSPTEEAFARQVGEAAATLPAGAWLTGGGWNHEQWPGGQLPTRARLDRYTGDHPVYLTGSHGHMALVNSVALKIAGVTAETEDPRGGVIVRDPKTGEPTGVLKNNAMDLVSAHIPKRKHDLAHHYRLAQEKLRLAASLGVTGVSENLDDVFSLELYNRLLMNGDLTLRAHVYALIEHLDDWIASGLRAGVGNRFLRFCGLKSQVDGALGSASAYFLEPYEHSADNRGLLLEDLSPGGDLETRLRACIDAGLQPMTHAIGDAAIRQVLDIYQRIGGDHPARYRFRIEHAQHPHPDDIRRFGELGVVASVQPYSAMETARFAEKRLGEKRCETTFPFRSFLDAGAVLAFGSDGLGDSFSPLLGIYAAVTRNTVEDEFPDGWFPAQRISVEEALRAYTFGTAYASFYDNHVGSLTPGRLADLAVLDTDILTAEPEQIRDAHVLLTIFDGRKVWLAPDAPWPWPDEESLGPDAYAWSQQMAI